MSRQKRVKYMEQKANLDKNLRRLLSKYNNGERPKGLDAWLDCYHTIVTRLAEDYQEFKYGFDTKFNFPLWVDFCLCKTRLVDLAMQIGWINSACWIDFPPEPINGQHNWHYEKFIAKKLVKQEGTGTPQGISRRPFPFLGGIDERNFPITGATPKTQLYQLRSVTSRPVKIAAKDGRRILQYKTEQTKIGVTKLNELERRQVLQAIWDARMINYQAFWDLLALWITRWNQSDIVETMVACIDYPVVEKKRILKNKLRQRIMERMPQLRRKYKALEAGCIQAKSLDDAIEDVIRMENKPSGFLYEQSVNRENDWWLYQAGPEYKVMGKVSQIGYRFPSRERQSDHGKEKS